METWHIEFGLSGSGIDYAVRGSFGVVPSNDPDLADAVFTQLPAGRLLR
jgi:sulfite reductase (NADPH) flavoprotein alpha-component